MELVLTEDIIQAMSYNYNYNDVISNPEFGNKFGSEEGVSSTLPNPETREEFAQRKIIEFIKDNVKAFVVNSTVAAMKAQITEDADVRASAVDAIAIATVK